MLSFFKESILYYKTIAKSKKMLYNYIYNLTDNLIVDINILTIIYKLIPYIKEGYFWQTEEIIMMILIGRNMTVHHKDVIQPDVRPPAKQTPHPAQMPILQAHAVLIRQASETARRIERRFSLPNS